MIGIAIVWALTKSNKPIDKKAPLPENPMQDRMTGINLKKRHPSV